MSQHPLPPNLHLETLAVRLATDRSQYGENSEALYLTSGYVQPSAEASARRFAGEEEGYTYGRSGNPTVTSFEMRLAARERTEAALATSSVAILPPAPERFSTMTDLPRLIVNLLASVLATRSAGPPGGNGTMNLIERSG